MAVTKLVLDRQATAQTFSFGTTSASGGGLVTIYNGTAAASTLNLDVKGSASVGGDLAVLGNLNIAGSINETSVTNLIVTDKTILLNNGAASDASAVDSGVLVQGASAVNLSGLVYTGSGSGWAIGSGTFSAGAFATKKEIADLSTAQTFTNKSLTSPTLTGSPVAPTPTTSDNSTLIATTAFVKAQGYLTSSTGVTSITGTANQVVASASTGAVTLSLPQSINTGAAPQFSSLTLAVATGTSPLNITSTTKCSNLNVDKVDDADLETTLTSGNTKFPSSGAVATYVTSARDRRLTVTTDYTRTDGTGNGTVTGARLVLANSTDALRANTEKVFLNGQLLMPGSGNDYVIATTGDGSGVHAIYFTSSWTTVSGDNIQLFGVPYTDPT